MWMFSNKSWLSQNIFSTVFLCQLSFFYIHLKLWPKKNTFETLILTFLVRGFFLFMSWIVDNINLQYRLTFTKKCSGPNYEFPNSINDSIHNQICLMCDDLNGSIWFDLIWFENPYPVVIGLCRENKYWSLR